VSVDGSGHDLFAHAALSCDQHIGFAVLEGLDKAYDLEHGGGLGQDASVGPDPLQEHCIVHGGARNDHITSPTDHLGKTGGGDGNQARTPLRTAAQKGAAALLQDPSLQGAP